MMAGHLLHSEPKVGDRRTGGVPSHLCLATRVQIIRQLLTNRIKDILTSTTCPTNLTRRAGDFAELLHILLFEFPRVW